MTAEAFTIEPEVEALLLEVARNPDSVLFRVPRKAVVPALLEDRPSFSSRTAALTSAEREIVRVHGAEVAWLLRQACLRAVIETPRDKPFVNRYRTPNDECQTLSVSELQEQASNLRTKNPLVEPAHAGLALLDRLLAEPRRFRISVAELAAASHRIEPTHQARVLAAADLAQSDSPRMALSLFSAVRDGFPSPLEYARSCEGMGFVFHKLGDPLQSRESYARALAREDGTHLHAAINQLILAFEFGFREDAVDCAGRLDGMLQPNHALVDWYASLVTEWARSPEARTPKRSNNVIRELGDRIGGVARRIANAFV